MRECLCADDKRAFGLAAGEEIVRRRQSEHEAGADGLQVESCAVMDAEFCLHARCCRGKREIRRRCSNDDEVDILGFATRIAQCSARGGDC